VWLGRNRKNIETNIDKVEEELLAIRRARAQGALKSLRAKGKADRLERMSAEEIDAVANAARRKKVIRSGLAETEFSVFSLSSQV